MTRLAKLGRLAALIAVAGLGSGCGFTPIYADNGTNLTASLGAIDVAPIVTADDSGYMLQTALQQKFGDSSRPEYRLEVTLNQKLVSEAITKQANTERYSVQVMAEYSLLDSLGTTMVNKTSSTSISYGVVASPYATQVARDNATRTAVEKIAGDIERTLIVYFKDTAETPPVAAAAVAE